MTRRQPELFWCISIIAQNINQGFKTLKLIKKQPQADVLSKHVRLKKTDKKKQTNKLNKSGNLNNTSKKT